MEATPKRNENIQVKLVKWYKSAFKVEFRGEPAYEFEIDAKTKAPVRDHRGNIVLKRDKNGQHIPKYDSFGKQIIKPYRQIIVSIFFV